jgi:hypothetical protein
MEVMVRIRGKDNKGMTKYDEQYIRIEDLLNGLNNVMRTELRDDRTELWITDVHEIVLDLLELNTHFAVVDEIKLYP